MAYNTRSLVLSCGSFWPAIMFDLFNILRFLQIPCIYLVDFWITSNKSRTLYQTVCFGQMWGEVCHQHWASRRIAEPTKMITFWVLRWLALWNKCKLVQFVCATVLNLVWRLLWSERLKTELSAHLYGGVKNTQYVCLEKVLWVI